MGEVARDSETKITMKLRLEEALVFFEWLASLDLTGHPNKPDEPTQTLLWCMEAFFETRLPMLFDADYKDKLANAKASIVPSCKGFGE